MALKMLWEALETSTLGTTIAGSEWMFPTLETLHVISLVTVIGAIVIMDLRLLGLSSARRAVTAVSLDTIPVTWIAFLCAVMTGSLLFVSKATVYTANPYFLIKMGLLALAGINMALFHRMTWKTIGTWDNAIPAIPLSAKIGGGLSLLFWTLIVFCGRIIGFTLGVYA